MTLTTRLSVYSMAALTVVLAGFSTTLYLLSRTYLSRQVDEHLEAALSTLVAAAEIGPDGFEWEPNARMLVQSDDPSAGPLYWMVSDGQGHSVDRSTNTASNDSMIQSLAAFTASHHKTDVVKMNGQDWRLLQRRLEMSTGTDQPTAGTPRGSSNHAKKTRYPILVLGAAVSQKPVQHALHTLAAALIGVSSSIWLLALFGGRFLCRRALAPLTRMAAVTRRMNASDLVNRLPRPETGDELDDLSESFNGLLERLHESFERQRRFTGDASHQLRTPLTAILGQIEVAVRRKRTPDEYERTLILVQEQGARLHQIVEMLLFLARADADAQLPNLEIIDLGFWLQTHLKSWAGHPRANDLRLESNSDVPLWVKTHPVMLAQLVDNLLDNACKYSVASTAVILRLSAEDGIASLEVQDAGCGIAPDDLPHVFEPFYRSPHARRLGFDGVGLGLAVAKRIALALGGEIFPQSGPTTGSCFTLRLPTVIPRSPAISQYE